MVTRQAHDFATPFGLWLVGVALLLALTACQSSLSSAANVQSDGDSADEQDTEISYLSCQSAADCPESMGCDNELGRCRTPVCQNDAECQAQRNADFTCVSGFCQGKACQSQADCLSANYCSAYRCRLNAGCADVQDIEVTRFVPLIRKGDVRHLAALGKDRSGVVIPGLRFVWRSMNTAVAQVGEGGELRGGALSGTTTLTVNLDPTVEACAQKTLYATLTIHNFAPIAADEARVVVIDAENDERIDDATVVLEDGQGRSRLVRTDADSGHGVALFSDITLPLSVHVFHADYHYTSLLTLTRNDLIVPLMRNESAKRMAGAMAELDFSALGQPEKGQSAFAWFGFGVGPAHWDLGPLRGVAPKWRSRTLLGSADPWPANIVLSPKLSAKPSALKVAAFSHEGPNTAWAMGGYIPADDLVGTLYHDYGLLGTSDSAWMLGSLAFAGNFRHGQLRVPSLSSQSLIPDDGRFGQAPYNFADVNGDGSTDDWVPDFAALPLVGTLSLTQPLDQSLLMRFGQAPYMGQACGLITCVGGWDVNDSFLPLGLAATLLNTPVLFGPSEGGVLQVPYAAPYGALDGNYGLVTFVLPFDGFFSGTGQFPFSAIVNRLKLGSTSVDSGDFLGLGTNGAVDLNERRVHFSPVGAYPTRLRFVKDERVWDLWLSEIATLNGEVELKLPFPPYEDPVSGSFEILTADLSDGHTLDELVSFSDTPSLTQLYKLVERYSRAIVGLDTRKIARNPVD